MKKLYKVLVSTLFIATFGFATVTVDGYAYLENLSDHSGVTITFERTAPSALTETATTDANGLFTAQLETGIYDVTYTKNEYFSESLTDQSFFANTTLSSLTLLEHTTLINVPSLFSTIQTAINYAFNGDTVLVQPGTYIENIIYSGKNIVVGSLYLTTGDTSYVSSTIIDGNENEFVVRPGGQLIGFTIQNGSNGIYCYNYSSPTLKNLIIRNNSGSGIYCYNHSSPHLENVTITNNGGQGIYIRSDSNPTLKNLIIRNNSGNGIHCLYSSKPSLVNVTITKNSGSGIYCSFSGKPKLFNTIVSENIGYGIYVDSTNPRVPIIRFSNFFNNNTNYYNAGIYVGVNITTNVNGDSCDVYYNIQENPYFINSNDDYYNLSDYSYCIGAGTDSLEMDDVWINAPTTDIDGNPRPNPENTNPDIGAYENPYGVPQYQPQVFNVPADYSSIQAALTAANATDTVLVQPGTYTENIIWPETNGIKLISAGDSSNTIIDGGGISSVIYMNPQTATIDTTTLIQGFKITNGLSDSYGGGIACIDASIIIKDCIIIANEGSGCLFQNSTAVIKNSKVRDNNGIGIAGLTNSNILISNCEIKNNHGTGIFFNSSNSGTISDCVITENMTSSASGVGRGGGIYCYGNNSTGTILTLTNVIISNNIAGEINTGVGDGGGLYLVQNIIQLSLINVTISNNTAVIEGGGLYLDIPSSTSLNTNNVLIIGNTSYAKGGGIYLKYNASLTDMTISNNIAQNGGGIYLSYSDNSILTNLTISGNEADLGGGMYIFYANPTLTNVMISNNIALEGGGIHASESNASIYYSNLLVNGYNIFNDNLLYMIDATNNYWGDSSGPYHPSQNPSGQGDSVSTYVNVDPWLTEPNTDAPPIPAQNTAVTGTGNDFISLKWDASEIGDLAGYKLYYDSDSSYPYANSVDVGTDTSYTLSSLTLGTTYYLAVTTYDTDGNESWYSNEVTGVTRVMQVQSLDIGGDEDLQHMVNHTPSISFGYYDSMNETQTSYQVQVSSDSLFSSADMWDSGEVTSSDTTVTYAGTTLEDGTTYYLRVKVGAGTFYSDWSSLTFRMNTVPTIPVLVSPINDQVTATPVVLNVFNASDAEGDAVTYSFNVYDDATLTTKIDSVTNLSESTDTTNWQVTASLPDNGQYFWTVSTNDGYEESTVSTAASFLLNISNDAPAAFALLSPADSAEVTILTPLLDWASASDPDPIDTVRYTVHFGTMIPDLQMVSVDTATSYQVSTSLSDNTTYYWKVIAIDLNDASTENTGGYHSFRVNTVNDLPGDFALLSPEDGSMVTDLTPTLHWEEPVDPDDGRSNTGFNDVLADIRSSSQTNSRSITSYYVYVDTTLSLTGVIPDTVTTNSYTPAVNLLEDEMYYWKVEAVDDDGGVTSSAMWSFWTNSENSAPSAITLLTPTANEQTSLTPTFSWTASSDADLNDSLAYTLRYGTDVSNLTDVSTGTQTTYTPTNDLTDNTGYFWQVLATDLSDATYSTAFSSFIVNSANDSPDAFSLISPDSGSVITDSDVLLFWNTAVDNDGDQLSYALYLSQDLASLTAIDTLNVNYYEATDLTEGNYYWKVTAFDELGGSTTTATWSFLVNAENDAPDAFTLLSPTDDAELTTLTPSFTWHSSSDADIGDQVSYTLELGESFDSLSVAYSGSDTTFTSTTELSDNTTYYWRVIAADLSGATTYNTVGYWSFRVNTENDLPGDFALLSPDSGSMVTDLTPTLYWEEPVDPDDRSRSIVSYYVYLDTTSGLTGVIPDTVNENSYTPTSDLLEDAMYYWKVEAVDDDGGMNTSAIWSFSVNTLNSPPSAFALLSPAPDSVNTTQVMYFEWESATDADPMDDVVNYSLDIHVDTVHMHYDLNTTSFISDGLTDNSIYHWSVTAHDMNGGTTVNTGGPRMFVINTENEPPSASTLVAPLNGSIQTDLTPNFYWTEATDLDPLDHVSYTMNWWPTGVLPVIYSINTDSTGVSPDEDITDNSQFGWMVVANDMHNSQSTSDTSYFYSDAFPEPPLNFATVAPENNVEGLATEVEFVWEETDDPDPVEEISYRVVYATNWEDSSTYVYSETIQNTSMVITLADNSQYNWLVEALDSDGFIVGSNNNTPNAIIVGTLAIDGDLIPVEFALHQNYPNPFNPITTLRYDLPEQATVNIIIYDMLGREVKTLVNSTQDAGFKSVIWNATNDYGKPVSAGVYLYQIRAGEFVQTKKMVLLK